MLTRTIIAALIVVGYMTSAFADTPVTFNYQGRVKVGSQDFQGNGYFKFAIINTSGSATLWTNDGTASGEPVSSITLPVSAGLFSVLIGDPSLGMQTINSSILNSQSPLKLRTWFSDGVNGFEQLNHDSNLVNLTLVSLQSGSADFDLYVNHATGDDSDNGLSPAKAKRTIQGAVSTVPGRLNASVVIHVAAGVYPEDVALNGISTLSGKTLTIEGDTLWTAQSVGNPNVIITGADEPSTAPLRLECLNARMCDHLILRGLYCRYATSYGMDLQNGVYDVENCMFTNNVSHGAQGRYNAVVNFRRCLSSNNGSIPLSNGFGLYLQSGSQGEFDNCIATNNVSSGFALITNSVATFKNTVKSDNNGADGIQIWDYSHASLSSELTGEIKNNGGFAVSLIYFGRVDDYDGTVGNGHVQTSSNVSGTLNQQFGGVKFW